MLFLLYLYASLNRGEEPSQRFKKILKSGYEQLVLPLARRIRGMRRWLGMQFESSGRRWNHSQSRPSQNLEQARFELLAAYPVDRANPSVSQRIRMLRLQQSILYGRLKPQGVGRYLVSEPTCREELVPDPCMYASSLKQRN